MSASSRVLDEDGICRGYKMAKNKVKQLQILADLNAIKKKEVIEILAKYGLIADSRKGFTVSDIEQKTANKRVSNYNREYYLQHKIRINARNVAYSKQHREEINRKAREKYAKKKAVQTAGTV